jgi:hypothetical protein
LDSPSAYALAVIVVVALAGWLFIPLRCPLAASAPGTEVRRIALGLAWRLILVICFPLIAERHSLRLLFPPLLLLLLLVVVVIVRING